MPELKQARTGLDVGFGAGGLPEKYAALQGGAWRSIALADEFPFDDAQFEAVVLSPSAVSLKAVREAHRVLRPDGSLYFAVPAKTRRQEGFTLPEIYAIVREGYNIVEVSQPKWWNFASKNKVFSIRAVKKNWRNLNGATYRPYV